MLVTGSRKGRRVNGHFREMRSRWMAMSSEFAGVLLCVGRACGEVVIVDRVGWVFVSSICANQVEECGSGGISSLGNLESWTMR